MPVPIVALLGGLLRSAGASGARALTAVGSRASGAATSLGQKATSAAGRFAPMLAQNAGKRDPPERYDRAALSRRLGVINPSLEQEQEERRRIADANIANQAPSVGKTLAKTAGQAGLKVTAMATAVGLATKGTLRLGEAMNNTAINNLRVFNASLAALGAKQEAFRMGHMVRYGKMVEGTTTSLGEKMMKVKEGSEPYAAFVANLGNLAMGVVADLVLGLQNLAESIGLTAAIRLYNKIVGPGPAPPAQGGLDFLERAKRGVGVHGTDADNMRPDDHPGARPGAGFP